MNAKQTARQLLSWQHWTRYRAYFTREGLSYLGIMMVVFIGALLGRSNLLLLVFGLLAGPFVMNGYVTLTMLQRTTLRRRAPDRVMMGELFSVELELVNNRRWLSSWMMVAYDRLHNLQEVLQPCVLFARVGPRAAHALRYQARLMQRGKYEFGPLKLATRFPLGLVDRSLTLDSRDEILVHPLVGRLTSLWRREELAADQLVEQARSRAGTFDDEFHRMREYRSGDNPRAIHWRTSARRNELIVREYHQHRDRDLAVMLDLWLPPAAQRGDWERVELAVSFAATVCVDYCRANRESTLFLGICGAPFTRQLVPASPLSMNAFLDPLALAQPLAGTDLERLAREPFLIQSPRLRTVLITTRPHGEKTPPEIEQIQGDLLHRGARLRTVHADRATLSQYFTWNA